MRIGVPLVRFERDVVDGRPSSDVDSREREASWIDDLAHPERGPVSWLAERAPSGAVLADLESLPEDLVEDDYDAVEIVALWARLEAYCAAGKRRASAAAARSTRLANGLAHLADRGIEVGDVSIAGDELAIRLGITKPAARRLIRSGEVMEAVGIPTAMALEAGDIDGAKADVVLSAIDPLGADAALDVQDRVLPKATHVTVGMLRREVAAACAAVDPEQFEDRCARTAQTRRVNRPRVLPHGMASLYAVLPAVEATQVYRAVDAAARSAKADGDERTMDHLRADALAAMGVTALESGWIGPAPAACPSCRPEPSDPHETHAQQPGQPGEPAASAESAGLAALAGLCDRTEPDEPTGPVQPGDSADSGESGEGRCGMRVGHIGGASAHVRVVVPYTVLMDDPPDPSLGADAPGTESLDGRAAGIERPDGHAPGLPSRHTSAPDQLTVAFLEGYGPIPRPVARALAAGSTWSRLVMDPVDRTVLEASTATYRPPASMARLVRAAQPTCASPVCSVGSDSCDLNHRVPHPIGATSVWNLDPACRRDHVLITHAGWGYADGRRPGTRVWTTATGHTYVQTVEGEVTMGERVPVALPGADAEPPF